MVEHGGNGSRLAESPREEPTPPPGRPSWPLIALFALAKLGLHLTTSSGYGYFRDELYYLACSDRLAAGYVDHPPLSIFVLWVVRHTLGDSLLALRTVPAILGAATVALVGLMAARLGGGRWAQALAMTGALVAPVYLALNHTYSLNSFDLLFWALAAYLVIRLIDDESPRRWLLLGLVLGLGLLNKISVLWLGAGLAVGLLATPLRRRLATPWPWLSAAVAAVVFTPHLVWQVANGWPTLEFIRNAAGQKMAPVSPLDFVAGQLDRDAPGRPAALARRARSSCSSTRRGSGSGCSAGPISPSFSSSPSRVPAAPTTWPPPTPGCSPPAGWPGSACSPAPASPAWGGCGRPRWGLCSSPGRWRRRSPCRCCRSRPTSATPGPSAASRRRRSARRSAQLKPFFADMQGWEAIVATLAEVYDRLPPEDRAMARIMAPDYGIAGAVDLLGRARGLPPALSAHNNYWLWGPRGWDGRVLIVVGGDEAQLSKYFERVERAATLECGLCMPYENHRPVWIARGLRVPVAAAWARAKHYD